MTEPATDTGTPAVAHGPQPMPVNRHPELPGAHELVLTDLLSWPMGCGEGIANEELRTTAYFWIIRRQMIGLETYGQPLLPDDGRDQLRDAIEETADLLAYLANLRRQGQCTTGTYASAMSVYLDLCAEQYPITKGLRVHRG